MPATPSRPPKDKHAGMPSRSELLNNGRGEDTALLHPLTLSSPASLDDVPPILAFNRVREVELPWADIMAVATEQNGAPVGNTQSLRHYFETSWWGEDKDAPTAEDLQSVVDNGHIIVLPEVLPEGQVSQYAFHRHVREKGEEGKAKDVAKPITEGVLLRDAISQRFYLVATFETVTLADLTTTEGYQTFWIENADAAMVVGESAEDALAGFSSYRELNMRETFIEQRYAELKVFEDVAKAVDAKASDALDGLLELSGTSLDFSAFEAVQERYVNARLAPARIRREMVRLKRQAEDMNYILFLGDESVEERTITFPDETTTVATAGELYEIGEREVKWTVWYRKSIVQTGAESLWHGVKRFFGGARERPTKDWPDPQKDTFDDFVKVDTLTDKLAKDVRKMRAAGKEVFVFEETPSGYMTVQGEALTMIMARCRYEEAFRRRCVVLIPIFEQGFSVVKPVVAYHVFERPMPGLIPSRMPRLFMDENLSYRTAWKGTELGELVGAINLTPGEEREMTITRSVTRETTATRSTSSLVELTSQESTDLSSEMERIARVDNEFTAHGEGEIKQGSTSQSEEGTARTRQRGGENFLTGLNSLVNTVTTGNTSSSYKFGASDTLKTFSQTMNSIARKAATSISRKNRQEINSSTKDTSTVTSTDSTVIKLSNINKGRTLNLMFYRVYNRYAAGLYIDDLRFGLTEGTELIAGSGIYNTRSFRPNQLRQLLYLLEDAPLPFDFSDATERYLFDQVLDMLLATLGMEYLESEQHEAIQDALETDDDRGDLDRLKTALPGAINEDEVDDGETADVLRATPTLLGKVLDASNRATTRRAATAANIPDEETLAKRIDALAKSLGDIRLRSRPLGQLGERPGDLLVASSGLYLDSMLGARPATEPYSEEMRAQEVRKSAAEVLRSEAEAEYTRAQASRIANRPQGAEGEDTGNVLTGVHLLDDPRVLTLGFLMPLTPGKWVVCDNGRPVNGGEIPIDQFNRTTVVIKPPRGSRRRTWLEAQNLMARITLRNLETDEEIHPG